MEILTLIIITYLILIFTGWFVLLYFGTWGYTIKPVISTNQEIISVKPSMIYLVLTSFLNYRILKIDQRTATLTISARLAWIFSSDKKVRFDDIKKIQCDYFTHFRDRNKETTEEFMVSLILHNDKKVKLFSFVGSSGSGSQEASSREFVELMSTITCKKLI